MARVRTLVKQQSKSKPRSLRSRPAARASSTPAGDKSTSHQPVKRFSRFHCDWPWRIRTSLGIDLFSLWLVSFRLRQLGKHGVKRIEAGAAEMLRTLRRPAIDRVGQIEIVLERHFQ